MSAFVFAGYHVGRSWSGTEIEDDCPCRQAPCGLVIQGESSEECDEHHPSALKAFRQGHSPGNCPGKRRG